MNEQLQAAKDKAAQEAGWENWKHVSEALHSYRMNHIIDRAMEIYAEMVNENSLQLSDIRNKLSPIKNIIAMIDNGLVKFTVDVHPLVSKEIENCKTSIEYLTNKTTKP